MKKKTLCERCQCKSCKEKRQMIQQAIEVRIKADAMIENIKALRELRDKNQGIE